MALLAGAGFLAGLWSQQVRHNRQTHARTIHDMQQALATSKHLLHCIFEQAAVGICMATLAGEMRLVNQKLCDMLGYSREELLKLSYKDITYPEDWPPQVIHATRLKAGEIESYSMEKRYICKDGSLIWANLTCSAIRGDPTYVVAVVADIADRKQAEESLKRVEDRYSALFDRSLDCVYLLDFNGHFLDANPAALELLGYTREEIPTLDLVSIVDAEQLGMAMQRMREVIETGRTQSTAEFRLRRKDGRIVAVESKASIILHDGKPVAIQGIARDITDRKLAEEALRESEAKFRSLAENMQAAVGIVQGKGFVYANRYMGEMLGYSIDEILAMDFPQLVHPDQREKLIDLARRRQAGENVPNHYEFIAVTRSGEQRWVDFSVAHILYKGRPAIVGAGFDITARKRIERQLLDHGRGLKFLADAATRLLAARRPHDASPEVFEALANHIGADVYVHYLVVDDGPKLHLHSYHGLDQSVARQVEDVEFGQIPCASAAQHRHPVIINCVQQTTDGLTRLLRDLGVRAYACHPLMVGDRVLGTLSFFASDRDQFTEEQLDLMHAVSHQAAMALEHQRLTDELERRAAELAEANHAKDHFMAALSHELRTPLTPVLAAAGALQNDTAVPPHAQEYLEIVRRNTELEARLIDDLLDVTRIVRGKIDLNKQQVELAMIITHAVEVCAEDVTARNLHLRLDLGNDAPYWVEADPDRLQQVFWNLLKNSIKFTPTGGCVGVRCRCDDGHVVVEVTDSGEGIAPEAIGRIFRPFEQAERAITRQFGGLGLGLAITKALVELHGGTISAHSAGKGLGATFRVELPRLAGVAAPSPNLSDRATGAPLGEQSESGPPRQLRILLVEDHGDTAKMLSRLLRNEGYEVKHAADVATAEALVEHAQREAAPFDLLLSDLGLPDASGNDLMRDLRARGQTLPGIALSGYGMASDIEQSRAAGFAEHVTKPVSFPTLKQAISRTVRSSSSSPNPGHPPGKDAR